MAKVQAVKSAATRFEMPKLTQRQKLDIMLGELKEMRTPMESHWKDLGFNFLPRSGRWADEKDQKAKDRQNKRLINSTPRLAARTLGSGMMAGLTSPARPWFRLTTPDTEMMEFGPVKSWLYFVENSMRDVFSRSNLYNVLPKVYEENGVFGTMSMAVLSDPDRVIRCYPFTIGSYWIALDSRLRPNSFVRQMTMTAYQMAQQFGTERLSPPVIRALQAAKYQTQFQVLQYIIPNDNRNWSYDDAPHMPYSSFYYELIPGQERNSPDDGLLQHGGFEENPVLTSRWDVTGEDAWGTSPAMDCLGDARAVQIQERRKAQAVDKHVEPPLWGNSDFQNAPVGQNPGDITFGSGVGSAPGLQPIYQIKPAITELREDIAEMRDRINDVMYTNLFLALTNSDRREITAREIDERHEEKLLQLGPILERINDEFLDPLIDRTFAILQRSGRLPQPPPELENMDLKVEYISILAQAQKQVALSGLERTAAFTLGIAAVVPNVTKKIDWHQMVDEYGHAIGIAPTVIKPDDVVAQEQAAEDERNAQMQMAQLAPDLAKSGKMLAETPMGGDTALSRMTGNAPAVAVA